MDDASNPLGDLPDARPVAHKNFLSTPTLLKGIVIGFIVCLVCVASLGFFSQIIPNNSSTIPVTELPRATSTPVYVQPTKLPNQIATKKGWKVYSDDYTFSLEYPSDLKLDDKMYKAYGTVVLDKYTSNNIHDDFYLSINSHSVNDENMSLKQFIDEELPGKISKNMTSYKNGNLESYVYVGGYESQSKTIYLKNKHDIIEFGLANAEGAGTSYKDNPNAEKLLDEILSTLKFLR